MRVLVWVTGRDHHRETSTQRWPHYSFVGGSSGQLLSPRGVALTVRESATFWICFGKEYPCQGAMGHALVSHSHNDR